MWIVNDVRCANEHIEISHLHRKSTGPDACPTCGEPRTVFYAMRETQLEYADPTVGTFRPIELAGQTFHDKASLDRYLDMYSAKHKVPRDQIALDSRGSNAERKVFREELRHEAWRTRLRSGYDTQQFREHQQEQRDRGRS